MICDTENEIIHISRQILYTYFVENQQDYLLSLIADDMVFVGMGKHLKAEGRQAICQMFTAGREQMFPCIMTDETYIARPLGKDYWFCEAQSDLETQPGLPIFSHECQRTTFIYRRNPDARSGLGWELVHLNNSVAWKQIRPQELFAWSSSMKNYDLLQQQSEADLTQPDLAILYDMIDCSVYVAMDEETQELLQLLCIFPTFTGEQAEYMWRRGNAAALLASELPHNVFLTFDALHSQYRFHHTFAGFLKKQAAQRGKTWQQAQLQQAAAWYLQEKNYSKAMALADAANAYEILLTAVERGGAGALWFQPFTTRCRYFEKTPQEIQRRHMLAGVILALDIWVCQNKSALYEDQKSQLLQLLKAMKPGTTEAGVAEGYLELLQGITSLNHIPEMTAHLQRARQLLPQGIPDLSIGYCLSLGSPSLLYVYHSKPGSLEDELAQLQDMASTTVSRLDQYDCSGLADTLEAERLYFQGRLEEAEIKAFAVLERARQSPYVTHKLIALFLQARLGLAKGSWEQVRYFLNQAEEESQKNPHPLHHQTWRLGTTYVYATLGLPQGIAEAVTEGVLPAEHCQSMEPFFYILYEKSLLLRGEYRKLAGLFPLHYEAASAGSHVLAQIYLSLFAAIAQLKLFRRKEGLKLLQQALSLARADNIIMPFAEHMEYIALPLQQLLHENWNAPFIQRIQEHSLEEKFHSLKQQIDEEAHGYSLTPREKETLQLIMTGLSNRAIAEKLNIAEVTVKKTLSHLYKKTGVKTRTSLIHYFSQHGEHATHDHSEAYSNPAKHAF